MTRGVRSGPCTIEGCGRPGNGGSGFCRKHVQRYRAHGDPTGGGDRFSTPAEALAERTIRLEDGCLAWIGSLYGNGYGQINTNGRPQRAHRVAWELKNGPIPEGMLLDHTCFKRCCVETDHLRLATRLQNNVHRSTARSDSTTGIRNVSPHGDGFRVSVKRGGQKHPLSKTYSTLDEALLAADLAREDWFGDFAGR